MLYVPDGEPNVPGNVPDWPKMIWSLRIWVMALPIAIIPITDRTKSEMW